MTKEYNRRGAAGAIKHPSVTVNGRATELGGRTHDQVEAWFDQGREVDQADVPTFAEWFATRQVRCPQGPDTNDVNGCGQVFSAKPDAEGFVDCPHCGLFFDPDHPHSSPQPELSPFEAIGLVFVSPGADPLVCNGKPVVCDNHIQH